ncbi:MAG: hypothetical protein HON53_14430 [Planctomycetaceae bacterium]|jgi:hypothetical protein|nr:hypothetical protein [Planctomycetaceae bacterium]MBT6158240.1 hypothetical protein [Planctomycetaceae bacterium]MBT6487578.1 hypothetical protein [Planctomycetaceae bacterium]MBT6493236.1 hypothetical protein [Planctomycetaceae bacterium]
MRNNRLKIVGMGACLSCIAVVFAFSVNSGAHSADIIGEDSPKSVSESALSVGPPHPSLTMNRYVGVGSCAASGCHGGEGSHGTIGSEYSIWIQQDPHASAYSVLYEPLSRQIAKNLKLGPAHRAAECLSCHAVVATPDDLTSNQRFTVADGVGCESCHGPAANWLESHKRVGWQQLTPAQKSAKGFWDTDDLLTRTRICGSCHVGSPGREVNHDLIAAGHPPLKFEMSSYHERMPRHWNLQKDRRPHTPSMMAKLWVLGQVVSAEMTALQLAERASPHNTIWPEFSEYGCFACHHDLQPKSWRQSRGYAGRRPGDLAWGTWSMPILSTLAQATAEDKSDQINSSIKQLAALMGSPYTVDAEAVAGKAATAAELLSQWAETLNQRRFTDEEVLSLQKSLASDGQSLCTTNWDAAVQVYLGLVALERSRIENAGGGQSTENHATVAEELDQIRSGLTFPLLKDGTRYNSPQSFGPDRTKLMQEALEKIQSIVGEKQ